MAVDNDFVNVEKNELGYVRQDCEHCPNFGKQLLNRRVGIIPCGRTATWNHDSQRVMDAFLHMMQERLNPPHHLICDLTCIHALLAIDRGWWAYRL